jgi:hypothetical protein
MPKLKPPPQKWKYGKPSKQEIQSAIVRLTQKGFWNCIQCIAQRAEVYPVPRLSKGYERCYFFIDKQSYKKDQDNIGCIDTQIGGQLSIVIVGKKQELLDEELKRQFRKGKGYLVKSIGEDLNTAIQSLISTKSNFLKKYEVG